MTTAAAAVGGLLPSRLRSAVVPVLCLVRSEPVLGWAGDVMVCSTGNLLRMLDARPRVLDELAINQTLRVLGPTRSQPAVESRRPVESQPWTTPLTQPWTEPRTESWSEAAGPPLTRRPTIREWSLRRCVGHWSGSSRSHGALRRWLTLLVFAILLAGVLRPEVFGSLGSAAARTIEGLRHPSQSFGEHVEVQGSAARPPLEVVAERPVPTRSRTSRIGPGPGHQLLAVGMTVRNVGAETWVSYPSTTVLTLRDETDTSYGVNPMVRRAGVGKVMPAVIRVRPGRSVKGFMVFEVPRNARIEAVELTVGPGEPQRVRWAGVPGL